jgi:hypothetical protein
MDNRMKALLWTTVILAAAWASVANGLSDGSSAGVIAAVTAAAWASINGRRGCGKECRP